MALLTWRPWSSSRKIKEVKKTIKKIRDSIEILMLSKKHCFHLQHGRRHQATTARVVFRKLWLFLGWLDFRMNLDQCNGQRSFTKSGVKLTGDNDQSVSDHKYHSLCAPLVIECTRKQWLKQVYRKPKSVRWRSLQNSSETSTWHLLRSEVMCSAYEEELPVTIKVKVCAIDSE